jgi:hypothetical protein
MPGRSARRAAPAAVALALSLSSTGCGHLSAHWPWHHSPPPPPAPVHELEIGGAAAASFPQYWKRNTLLVDLSAASGTGGITLKPAAGGSWPVRVAFRVTPGSIGVLDVRAAQQEILPIVPGGGKPVDLELSPGTYMPTTPEMSVSWGPTPSP